MSEHQETAEHAEAAEHAKPARAGDEKPEVATRPVPPKHPSRQSLVVKPRSSGGPLFVFGAIVSAAAGFAVVFATGLGRSPDSDPSDARAVAEAPKVDATRTIEPPQGAVPTPQAPRFFVPAGDDQLGDAEPAPLDERPRSRFAATPVALEDSAGSGAASDAPPVGSSRFADAVPPANPVDAAEEPAPLLVPADDELPVAEAAKPRGAEPSQVAEEQEKTGETVADADAGLANATPTPPPTLPTATAATPSPTTPPATTVPPPTPLPAATDDDPPPIAAAPSPAGAATPSGLRAPPLESTFAAALAPMQPPASKNPVAPAGAPFEDHEAPIPVTPPGGGPSGPPAGRTTPDLAQPDRPPQDRFASTDATRGFGGAPTVTPPPTGGVPPSARAGEPDHDAGAGPLASAAPGGPVQADGRPGPIQLEGIQTPQLTIEKRGPREVQVGKVARYDMVVRNVGGVSAHDVTLRDRVPLGTKLVSTSPPAAPGDAGELVWTLGSLPQGGQARVAMEVMPTEEGEVGSVASVSFRADASVRSVATRAGLAIEAENPKAVLVGSAVDLAITVRNPGTGEATGVVLEGNVPSGFTHASGSALEYDVGRLKPGETRRIDLKLLSTHPGVQSLKLSARSDGRIETDHAVRLEVTAPTLELAANMPSRRYLQRPVTCVLSMNNAGTAPANTIELAAQLPPGMKFLRANNAGYYEESTHRVLWHLEQLPAAEVGSVEMVLVPTALGPQRIAAAARSADGLAAQVTHTVEVEGLAALLFEVGDSEDPIEVDGITEYVVRVGNQGTKAATGVRVTATLLGDLEPVDAKGPAAHRIENLSILFEPLATLAPAEESVYRIRVRGRRAGDQRVQVQVTSDDSQSPITKEEVTRVYADR